jgi:hypothetical protein
MTISGSDLAITIAYFSIPFQILVGLCRFPRLTRRATTRVVILLVLFALFIFLCGFGHLLRCMEYGDTPFFRGVNILTAVVSIATAAYLMPFVPNLLDGADKLYLEATASKEIIEKLYPPQIRQRLLNHESTVGTTDKVKVNGKSKTVEMKMKRPQRLSDHTVVRQKILDFVRGKSTASKQSDDSLEMEEDTTSTPSHNNKGADEENNLALDTSEPIADDFEHASIMFADISNFTYWSSQHTPNEVFTLLESIFFEFDRIAKDMGVYKLSTVGDCYIAVMGVPCPSVSFYERCLLYCSSSLNFHASVFRRITP